MDLSISVTSTTTKPGNCRGFAYETKNLGNHQRFRNFRFLFFYVFLLQNIKIIFGCCCFSFVSFLLSVLSSFLLSFSFFHKKTNFHVFSFLLFATIGIRV